MRRSNNKTWLANDRRSDMRRGGFSLMEMFVSVVVLGTVLTTFAPMLHSVRQQQRSTEQHGLALREAENLLEELLIRSWSELTNDELSKQTLPERIAKRLPNSELQIDVSEVEQPSVSKRVTVRVVWKTNSDRQANTVHVVGWFAKPEVQP